MKLVLILATLALAAPLAHADAVPCKSLEEFACGRMSCDAISPLPIVSRLPVQVYSGTMELVPLFPSITFMKVFVGPDKFAAESIPVDPATKLSNAIDIPTSDGGIEQGGPLETSCYRGDRVADGELKDAVHTGKAKLIYCEVI